MRMRITRRTTSQIPVTASLPNSSLRSGTTAPPCSPGSGTCKQGRRRWHPIFHRTHTRRRPHHYCGGGRFAGGSRTPYPHRRGLHLRDATTCQRYAPHLLLPPVIALHLRRRCIWRRQTRQRSLPMMVGSVAAAAEMWTSHVGQSARRHHVR